MACPQGVVLFEVGRVVPSRFKGCAGKFVDIRTKDKLASISVGI